MKLKAKRYLIGASMLEVMIATGIMGIGLIQVGKITNEDQLATKYRLTADQHQVFMGALERYAKDNYGALIGTGSLTAKIITVSTLKAAKKLPSGFSEVNPFGQTLCGLYSVPSSNSLAILAVSEGGNPIDALSLKKITANIGHFGGGIFNLGVIEGSASTWSISSSTVPSYSNFAGSSCSGASFGIGSIASYIFLDSSTLATDFLRRTAISGQPSATAMNSPLGLAQKIESAPCGTTAGNSSEENRVAISSSGDILICKSASGSWSWSKPSTGSFLKDPVSTYSALPASNNTLGDVRVTLDNNRAYFWNASVWKPLAIDSAGNLNVPGGDLSLGNGKLLSSSTSLNLRTTGRVTVTDSTGANPAGLTAKTINPSLTVTYGTSCSGYDLGTLARDSAGGTLACSSSGVWRQSKNYAPNGYKARCAYNSGVLITLSSVATGCHTLDETYLCNDGKFDTGSFYVTNKQC